MTWPSIISSGMSRSVALFGCKELPEPQVRVFCSVALVVLLASCCLHGQLIDQEMFMRSSLDHKIELYESAIQRRCVTNDMLQLLSRMAEHGAPAADAMAELFKNPRPNFPLEHAIIVFELTRFEGVNLVNHAGMAELRRLAVSGSDQRTRVAAQQAIRNIESFPPSSPPPGSRGPSPAPPPRRGSR